MKTLGKLIFVILMCCSMLANATKCFNGSSLKDLRELFPVVIKGKIIGRTKKKGKEDLYKLKIQVLEVVQGQCKAELFFAEEAHFGESVLGNHVYSVGQVLYFPTELEGKNKKIKVFLPADGCPSLPSK